MKKIVIMLVCLSLAAAAAPLSGAGDKNKAKYEKRYNDPVLKSLDEAREKQQAELDEETAQIRKRQAEEKKKERELARNLQSDMTGVNPPPSPADCKPMFHFPPVAQYNTNTCWSFATTSYYESEIFRLSGKRIKLSEVWTVYHEYLAKVRRFVQERGASLVAEGGESNAINRIWKEHGVVPAGAYPGRRVDGDKLDHSLLIDEIGAFLAYVKSNDLWNEKDVLDHVTVILTKHLGAPPSRFVYDGREMTPLEFLKNETPLDMDNYVDVMSTSYYPFYTFQEYAVPDNWWHSKEYLNVPLDVWYGLILKAVRAGCTVGIGGDVSEPGKLGFQDVCFVPSFDIPAAYIDQDSREFRIANRTTEDDHGIHIVGYKNFKGHDWFLVKDSGRSARWGKHEGYFFFRGDYVKLKMLTFTVPKDLIKDILAKVKK
jgi:bleomycin hydrolase